MIRSDAFNCSPMEADMKSKQIIESVLGDECSVGNREFSENDVCVVNVMETRVRVCCV